MGEHEHQHDSSQHHGEHPGHHEPAPHAHHENGAEKGGSLLLYALLIAALIIMAYNQFAILGVQTAAASLGTGALAAAPLSSGGTSVAIQTATGAAGGKDISNIDFSALKSTGHSVAALFPVENIKTQQDAIDIMIPTGTPDYGEAMGVSFDTPVESLALLAQSYEPLKAEVKQSDPETFKRFIALGTKPVGISCEYCCGVGPIGMDAQGNSKCGCQHNPAVLTVTLWLMKNTDKSDAEILKEVLRWKTLFFPKNMVELSLSVAGGDTSKLDNLPGMVGGC